MNHLDLLTFARGSALNWALIVFAAGVVLRLFEIFGLGRKADLARPRINSPGGGWRTMFTRSLPPEGMLKRDPVTYIGGYVFHLGLLVAIFFFAPHIEFFRSMTGLALVQLAIGTGRCIGGRVVGRLGRVAGTPAQQSGEAHAVRIRRLSGLGGDVVAVADRLHGLSPPVRGIHADAVAAPVLGGVAAGAAAVHQTVPHVLVVHFTLVQRRFLWEKGSSIMSSDQGPRAAGMRASAIECRRPTPECVASTAGK